ncbi:MAG: hypothetical protein ACLR8Y_06105 [Alistipes indistinctus]
MFRYAADDGFLFTAGESRRSARNNKIFGKIPALCAAEASCGAATRFDRQPDKGDSIRTSGSGYAATRISIAQSVEKRRWPKRWKR